MPKCPHLRTVGWQEWECAISGASVDDRCGIGLDDCIPLLAWRWVRGEVTFKRITRGLGARDITRKAVIAMAERILEREGAPLDLAQMSEAELGDLAGQIKAAVAAKAAARKQLPGLKKHLAGLHRDRERLDAEIATVAVAVEEIETGQPVRFVRDAPVPAPSGEGKTPSAMVIYQRNARALRRGKKMRALGLDTDNAEDRKRYIGEAIKAGKARKAAGLSPDAKALASALPGTVPEQLRR